MESPGASAMAWYDIQGRCASKHVAVPNLGDGGELDVGEQAWLHTDPDLRLNCEGRPENGDPVPRQW